MRYAFLGLLFCLMYMHSFATEMEPNDTRNTATKLNLNGSNTGAIGTATDVDWWKVATTSDGRLDVTLAVSNGLYCYVALYDNNGTTLLVQNYTNGSVTISQDGLAPGTYYIYIFPYFSGDKPSYTLSNALAVAPLANDVEPDGLYTQANTLALNGSSTGHVGYYYNLVRDTTDWWKFTTTSNGLVRLKLSVTDGQYVYYQLFDGDGTTVLNSGNYTNGSASYDVDGLAAGTYYVKIFCYYNSGFAPYTLTDSLFAPPVANDAEPDDKPNQAIKINLNGSKTGQVGYYYKGARDTTDWYKFTTNADGRVRMQLAVTNGQYIYYQLYDNDAKTVIDGSHYTNNTGSYDVDGLAAGTYYVKIFTYYSSGFGSYTITDSLFKTSVASDVEPNDTKNQALTFAEGSTVNGHIGYYYNLKRDTTDWYKLVTDNDGQINLTLTSLNNQYVYYQLYDKNGTTVIDGSHYTNTTQSYSVDGLAAGTYYVKIFCLYSSGFAPYTLSNSLSQYTNNDDGLNNDFPSKAATLNVGKVTPGHVGFRANGGTKDPDDWWKINYTGTGDMTVTLNWEPEFCCGSPYVYMRIYKDTTAAAIYDQYNNSGTLTASLTGLSQTYYYVQVITYYSSDWASYNLTTNFTQKNKATITLQSATTGSDCSNGSLVYKCARSHSPYSVQLYRFGLKYGKVINVKNTQNFTVSGLAPGSYYATAFGDGATGKAFGQSTDTSIVPIPTNLSASAIKSTKVTLNWDTLGCISYYSVQYRVKGTTPWTIVNTNGLKASITISGLTPATMYQWQVASADSANGETALSKYASGPVFTTAASKDEDAVSVSGNMSATLYPNPASSQILLTLQNANGKVVISLVNVIGQVMEARTLQADGNTITMPWDISQLHSGMYAIRINIDGTSQTLLFEKQ